MNEYNVVPVDKRETVEFIQKGIKSLKKLSNEALFYALEVAQDEAMDINYKNFALTLEETMDFLGGDLENENYNLNELFSGSDYINKMKEKDLLSSEYKAEKALIKLHASKEEITFDEMIEKLHKLNIETNKQLVEIDETAVAKLELQNSFFEIIESILQDYAAYENDMLIEKNKDDKLTKARDKHCYKGDTLNNQESPNA